MSESADEFLKQMMVKVTPAVLEIVQRKDSGHLHIDFANGEFKRAQALRTL